MFVSLAIAASSRHADKSVLAPLHFFNGREEAIIVWSVIAAFGLVAIRALTWQTVVPVLQSLVALPLLRLWITASIVAGGLVYAAYDQGIWQVPALKETLFWFATALILTGRAITSGMRGEPTLFRMLLRRLVRYVLVIDFFIALYPLPFLAELLFVVPALLLLVLLQFAEQYREGHSFKTFVDVSITAIGLALVIYSLVSALTGLDALLTREHAEDFLVGPALTIAFVPFLYLVLWWSKHQQRSRLRRLGIEPVSDSDFREALETDLADLEDAA